MKTRRMRRGIPPRRSFALAWLTWLPFVLSGGCADHTPRSPVLAADMPLHLEDHLDAATIEGSELPEDPPAPVDWRFDEPQPDWKPAVPVDRSLPATRVEQTADALRVTAPEGGEARVYVDVPDWRPEEWAFVVVRARTASVTNVFLDFTTWEGAVPPPATQTTWLGGARTPVVSDGSVQTYQIRTKWEATGSWRRLELGFRARDPGSIDVLSVAVVPTAGVYAKDRLAARSIRVGGLYRQTLLTHAPGRIAYRVRVPAEGRLDAALGVLGADRPVEFRVTAAPADGETISLLAETHADADRWAERSVDLSRFEGQTITLALETATDEPGTVAYWGSPTLGGQRRTDSPNVIFYVIDGAGADQMSAYGYNRRTTPNIERLAAGGAVFEHAYSNSSSTRYSTPSFMTSLHSSVLGNTGNFEALPAEVRTMAEQAHARGYQTAVFTTNPSAASSSNLERGVDLMRDLFIEPNSGTSVELHRSFWNWRDAFPTEPYWVHFQTTDVHRPHLPPAPFAGLFVSPEQVERQALWNRTLRLWQQQNPARSQTEPWDQWWAEAGVDRIQYFDVTRSRYDETMAHQDYQIGRFVERLQETGQWGRTLLIIAADHGTGTGSDDFLERLLDPLLSPETDAPILRSMQSRVPLIFVWPGRIAGGQRFRQPVSMIDVLPTVLELTGLPMPEVIQGQSLAPLLLGRPGWQPRPVILDEFQRNPVTGELQGQIEMIDGRWGASLWIGPLWEWNRERFAPLLLFDVWNDPMATTLMNDQYPELVQKYTELLQEQWQAHRLLARRFSPGGQIALTPGQLDSLRALGYIR